MVYLRTDDADYFEQMTQVFGANRNFQPIPTPDRLAAVVTDFERAFNERDIETNRGAVPAREVIRFYRSHVDHRTALVVVVVSSGGLPRRTESAGVAGTGDAS